MCARACVHVTLPFPRRRLMTNHRNNSTALCTQLRELVLSSVAAAGRRDVPLFVRYWLTAGLGNFDISPKVGLGDFWPNNDLPVDEFARLRIAADFAVRTSHPPIHTSTHTRTK